MDWKVGQMISWTYLIVLMTNLLQICSILIKVVKVFTHLEHIKKRLTMSIISCRNPEWYVDVTEWWRLESCLRYNCCVYFINTDKMHNNKVNSFAELLTLRESERDWSICLLLEIADVFPYWRENSNVSGKRFTSSPSVQHSVDGLNFNLTLECDACVYCVSL